MPISMRFVLRSTIGLLAVGFLALIAIVAMTIWLGEHARTITDEASAATSTRVAAMTLRDAVRTAESSQRGYMLTSNAIYLAPYDNAKAEARKQLRLLTTDASARSSAPLLVRLASVVNDKLDEMDHILALKHQRSDADALTALRTNRSKALMDETNLFLSGIILAADEQLATGRAQFRRNADVLRWVSIAAAGVIVLVVAGVTSTVLRYASEIAEARDEVRALNANLEERVRVRTVDLALERDRAEVLVAEVNHRVANSLAILVSMIGMQATYAADPVVKDALQETQGRISAIALLHQRLYNAGDARVVELGAYIAGLLESLSASTGDPGKGVTIRHELDRLRLPTDASIHLGIIVTELVTNAFKYAYPDQSGEIRVRLAGMAEGRAELLVEDDGVGRSDTPEVKGTGLGTRIVKAMATTLGGEIEYLQRSPGTCARLVFALGSDAAAPEHA
jgi:two-component sensor histidine kinase